jgi:hypothetical protein
MRSVNEILLSLPGSVTDNGGDSIIYNPVIRGFSERIQPIAEPSSYDSSAETYLEVNLKEYETLESKYQYRAVLVEGYVLPQNTPSADSPRVASSFTHYAAITPGTENLSYDIDTEYESTYNNNSAIYTIFNITSCWDVSPNNNAANPVSYTGGIITFKIRLKRGVASSNGVYIVSGIYYLI